MHKRNKTGSRSRLNGQQVRHLLLTALGFFALFALVPAVPAFAAGTDLRFITTTGGIAAGANTLTVASGAGFKVDDHVIVEIGKEPGQGQRGTRGVGGTWPSKSYRTVAQLLADKTQQNRLFAWAEDSGEVYWWLDGAWNTYYSGSYYLGKAIPRSLQARITAINGNTLTLDRAAAVAVSGANVYLDTAPIINNMIAASGSVVLPSGNLPIGGVVWIVNRPGFVLAGQGKDRTKLFSPKGVPSASIEATWSANALVKDLTLQGNFRDQGFGMNWTGSTPAGSNRPVTETDVPQGAGWPRGIVFNQGSHRSVVQDARVIDVSQMAVGVAFADEVWAYRVENIQNDLLRTYVQWQFQWTDTTGGGCVDCEVRSSYVIPGFEAFKATNVQFIRAKGTNALMAMNGAGGWLIQDAKLIFTANSLHPESDRGGASPIHPIININAGIGITPQLSQGGTIRNAMMIQNGYLNSKNDSLRGIVVTEHAPNVKVEGSGYHAPDYKDTSSSYGAIGLNSKGPNTVVDGMVVIGKGRPGYPNIEIVNGSGRNCSAETIRGCSPGSSSALAQLLAQVSAAGGVSVPSASSVSNTITPAGSSPSGEATAPSGTSSSAGNGSGGSSIADLPPIALTATGIKVTSVSATGVASAPKLSAVIAAMALIRNSTATSTTAVANSTQGSSVAPVSAAAATSTPSAAASSSSLNIVGSSPAPVAGTNAQPTLTASAPLTSAGAVAAIALPALSQQPPRAGTASVAYDFAGNKVSSILWRNQQTGQNAIWEFNAGVLTKTSLIAAAATDWRVVGEGDFDGDAKADILWQDGQGNVAIWLMNGTEIRSQKVVGLMPKGWKVAATGDFDASGRTDILWRHTNGAVALWIMNGLAIENSTEHSTVPSTWTIAGTGDFNADGKVDVLWRNIDGTVAMWLMDGVKVVTQQNVRTVGTEWSIVGVADYDGDRKADILWRHRSGENVIWLMSGATLLRDAGINGVPDAKWTIAGTGDYDGDGKADILWRNVATGDNALWRMDGFATKHEELIRSLADQNWTVMTH